jgi:hypothetical protein
MDEGVAILQSLMATEEMLITALWQYEDAMLFVSSDRCSWQRRAAVC